MQLAFELYAALELAHYLATLRRDPSMVERGRAAVQAAIGRATPGDDPVAVLHVRPDAAEPRRPGRSVAQ